MAGQEVDLFRLDKFHRIQELCRWGLNVPKYWYFRAGDPAIQRWKPSGATFSARFFTDHEDHAQGKQPHLPRCDFSTVSAQLYEHAKRYHVMLTDESYDPDKTVVCGNLQLEIESIDGFGIAIFEVIAGAGTVRDVIKRGTHLEFNLHDFARWHSNPVSLGLTRVKYQAMRCPYYNHGIFEFTVYPPQTQLGVRRDNIIFWEIRRRS